MIATRTTPVVTVRIVTYNQEDYIAYTIESVLGQETDFPFEILICDDHSTDRTVRIIRNYQRHYPEKIRLILNDHNLGVRRNFLKSLNPRDCRGRYIALLDGDDYWMDRDKLKKQVSFMEAHPECSLCFHNALKIYEDGRPAAPYVLRDLPEIISLRELLYEDFIPTSATLYRNHLYEDLPRWIYGLAFGDWPLHVINACYGKIGYIHEIMAVYRIHSRGIWSKGGQLSLEQRIGQSRAGINFYRAINRHLNYEHDDVIRSQVQNMREKIRYWNSLRVKTSLIARFPLLYKMFLSRRYIFRKRSFRRA